MKKNTGRVIINSLLSIVLMTVSFFSLLSEAQATEVKKESVASISEDVQETKTVTTKSGEISENDIEEAVEEAVVSKNETGTASEEISDDALGAVIGDDYRYKYYSEIGSGPYGPYYNEDTMYDEWLFFKRQCTSFVAWRLTMTNGLTDFNNHYAGYTWGDASTWGNAAAGLGILNNSPAVGAVAWDGSHVAWVAEVGDGTVTIEEYNCNCPESGYRWLCYSCRTVSTEAYQYIHFKDLNEDDRKPAFERGAGQTIAPGDYQIVSMVNPDMALDFQGYELVEDGARAQLYHNRDIDQDIFKLTYDSSIGCYRIQHKLSGLFLDVPDFNSDKGTFLKACHKSNPGYAQEWSIENAGDGWYTIKSRASGLYVNVESGGNTSDPDRPGVWQWDNDGSAAVKWAFVPYVPYQTKTIANGTYHIVSAVNSDMALDINGTKDASNVRIVKNRYSKADEFKVTFVEKSNGKGFYKITDTNNKLSLDVDEYRTDSRANIQAWTYNTSAAKHNQQWVIVASGGKYYIRSRHSGLYVNVANGSNANDGGNVWQYTWDGTNANLWSFVVPVKGVSISKTNATIDVGKTVTLTATVTPSGANKNVSWSSSNTNVATVNSSGVVTGKKAGTATITVKTGEGNKTANCKVTVSDIPVTSVTLNKQSTTIAVGKTETLTATIAPSNATNKAVTWVSSNPDVAAVDSNGVVTGKGAGTAVITVKTAVGGKTATCKVDVGTIPVITTTSLPLGKVGDSYKVTLQASGSLPITWEIASLSGESSLNAIGLRFDAATGMITGIPTASGLWSWWMRASNDLGSDEKLLSLKIEKVDSSDVFYSVQFISEEKEYETISVKENDTVTKPENPTKKGYTFKGWYYFVGGEKREYDFSTKVISNLTLYAEWMNNSGVDDPNPVLQADKVIVAGQKIRLRDVCFDEYDGKIARYKVDDKNIASVSKGMLTGKKAGTVKVTAQVSVGKNKYEDVAECNVTILSRPKLKFSAPLTYDGQTINAPDFFTTEDTASLGATSWESSNPKVVDVTDEEAGTLQAHKNGSAKITAYFGEKGKAGTLKVTATLYVKKPAFSKKEYTVLTGGKLTLSMKNVSAAMNPEWKAEDESVIRVTPQTNKKGDVTGKIIVEGLSSGDTTLTATIDGQEYACEIHVPAPVISRSTMNLKQGKSFTLALKSTKLRKPEIDWYTSDPDVATVDTNGKVIAIGEGEAIIYTETGGVLNECTVRVK